MPFLRLEPFIEDTASGNINWRERGIGHILEKATKGDLVIASEISRLGRSTLQVLEILELAAQKLSSRSGPVVFSTREAQKGYPYI